MEVQIEVNGALRNVQTEGDRPLLDVLREDLALTGTKFGCGEGQCRACTVLLDGKPAPSCQTPVSAAAGKKITTIEGLERGPEQGGALHPVQQAFLDAGAMQCGYCTPGMILTATALLESNPAPTDAEIAKGMNNNLCRCCGYPRIIEAVRRASRTLSTANRG
jgi:aerobic-type carbon monoxide dehydrogenase small subunit (CoxS/CutS family)